MNADIPNEWKWLNQRTYLNTFFDTGIILLVISTKIALNERLLLNANSAIFQLYHGENHLIFNEMMMFALY